MSKSRTLIASVLAFAIALPLTVAGILLAPAAEAAGGTLEVTKSVSSPGPYGPGDVFTYSIQVTCQSASCTDAELTDTLPPPLVLDGDDAVQVSAGGGGTYDTSGSDGDGGTTVDVLATGDQGDGTTGMAPGTIANVSIRVRVPADATADYNGTVTNTANVKQTGGNSDSDTADVTIDVPQTLDTTVTKTADPTSVPAVAGRDVKYTIDAKNTSNTAVDSLVISDPADGSPDPFQYVEVTGITSLTPPDGANTVQVSWTDADGNVTDLPAVSPIPSDPNDLLATIDPLSDIHGLTFTFSGPDGIPIDGEANIVLDTQTRDDVTDLPPGTTTTTNTASSDVSKTTDGTTDTANDTDDASVDIVSEPPSVTTNKTFADDHLLAGDSTTATIRSEDGSQPVHTMVIDEPTAGSPDLAAQGLTFGGFGADVEWPSGADSVSIVYDYSDGTSSDPQTSTDRDTIPGVPAGHTDADVVGFHITFSSDTDDGIEPGDAANIPFDVTAQPVAGNDDVTTPNDTTTTVTNADGQTGTDSASDDMTRQPARIDTHVEKHFTPDEIPGVPGASTIVSIPASVCGDTQVAAGDCDAASTVGSDDLIISDPVEPGAGLTDFWNHFNLTSIGPMDIPEGSTLTVNYWDGSSWQTLAGPIPAQSGWTYQVGSDPTPDQIEGIQFDFEPDPADSTLPPGFSVLPYMTFDLRDQLRDGTGSALPPSDATVPDTYTNDVESQVDNPDADTSPVTDDDSDDISVDPVDGNGPGDTIDKTWLDPTTGDPSDSVTVTALTDDERTARVTWGTHGFPMDQVQISDVPEPATSDTAIANTVYDAFDLVSVQPITPATDPLIAFDQVSEVELYSASANGGAGGWIEAPNDPCPSACDGTFPGYTLSTASQSDTLSVRLTYVESPTRASRITAPTDPQVGSGVAQSAGNDRPIDLVFRIRQDTRTPAANPVPVLGSDPQNGQDPQTYNTGQDGRVSNTARMDGWAPGTPTTGDPDYTDDDSAVITILDRPVDMSTTKSFEEPTLGLPPDGTAASDYPQDAMTLQASNDTEAKVRTMTIEDPDPGSTSNTFDLMDLDHFISITAPTGADASATRVFLTGASGQPADGFTAAAALALTPSDLADVTGVRVVFTGLIPTTTDATTPAGVVLGMRLRPTNRTTTDPVVEGDTIDNTSLASAVSPEGTASDTASDSVNIVAPTYGVNAGKTIDPASRNEGSDNDYTVTLTGKPTGTVRTKDVILTDDDPRFWNAFDFNGFATTDNVTPIARVKVDALVGVVYSTSGSTLVQTCNSSTDLTACWVEGDYEAANAPALPTGVTNDEVQGLRYTFDGGADLPNWEHPSNPTATGAFKATQRDFLRYGNDGGTDTPVPSDLSTNTIAPGETELGVTTDDLAVHADGSWDQDGTNTPWTADDAATDNTLLKHLPNSVDVTKTPGNGNADPTAESPNSPIAYQFVVTNTGEWPQTGVTIVDTLPTDDGGPQLVPSSQVLPADGTCADADPDFTVDLTTGGTTAPLDGASAQYCMNLRGQPEIVVNLPDGFVLQPGDSITVKTPLEYRGGSDPVDPGTDVVNSVTVSDDRVYDTCDSTHNASIDNPQSTLVDSCTSDTTTQPRALTPLRISKAVKGVAAGDPAVGADDPNYDDLGVIDVNTNDTNASGCQDPSVPNYDGDVIYYGSTCVPMLRPGGVARWQVRLTNAGNIPAHIVAGIDVLPTPGDTGVVVSTPRDSEFRPRLIGNFSYDGQAVTDDTPMKLYYTTDTLNEACNEDDILNETTVGGLDWTNPDYSACQADVEGRTWTEVTTDTPESQLSQATAIKAVLTYGVADEGLAPGDDLALTFDTRTPANAPQTTPGQDPIAWNSVAEGSQGVYHDPDDPIGDLSYPVSLVTEPPKVGIAMATGSVKLTKTTVTPDGTDFPLPDTYPVKLFCTSVGAVDQPIPVPVTILDQDGTNQSVVDVPRNGTITVNDRTDPGDNQWSNVTIPWGATCRAQEQPTPQGATVTYDPPPLVPDLDTSGPVTALQDYSSRTDIAHPIDTSPATINGIAVTNTYEEAGFTVTKSVDAGGAKDQDGNPISYDRTYDFSASCTFNNTEVVPADDQTFTLKDGDSKTIEGLPAGSVCTVEETDDGGAASTTIDTTTGDGAADPVHGTSTTFTITPDTDQSDPTTVTNAVAVANTYTVGSVEVTKAVTGNGADDWGQGPFVVHMVCTLDGTVPNPVYEADHTLTPPDDLTWTVNDLPTGASCSVTEPTSAGANTVAFDPSSPVIVGDTPDTPTPVTVTNSFTEGSVSVTKDIAGLTGAALAQAESDTYTFSLACTRTVDGLVQSVTIPGTNPVDVTPSVDPTGTWDGLPTGATCTVTELFPDGAAHPPTPTYDPSTVTVGDDTTVNVDVTNTFETAPLSVEKVVDGPAADAGAASYPVTATCTYEGTTLSLDPNDPDATPGPYSFDVVPGTPYTTAPLPIGTTCTVSEDDNEGATSTTISNDGNQEIASLTDNPDADTVTITNTYEDTGFTVSKAVDAGGAVDQDGGDISYTGSYRFTASCLLNGNQQVPVADRTFTLTDGQTHTITGVAANSVCTVHETGTQDAASTTMVVTQDGTAADESTGTSSGEFTLDAGGAAINAVAVTNHYTVGSVQVTKDVTGDGANDWGQGPFTVHMVCTLANTSPTPVYEADHTLTPPDDLTWTVDNLPTGASCAVTEPEAGNGGANSTTIDPSPIIVGDSADDPAVVTVTNTFTEGSVQATKLIGGLGGPGEDNTQYNEAAAATYTFSLTCTREVNGETVDVPIPPSDPVTDADDPSIRTVVPANDPNASWTGLPTGATCHVTEEFPNGEAHPPLVVVAPKTVTVGDGTTAHTLVLNGFSVAPLTIKKVVDGDAAAAAPTTYPVSVACFYGAGANRVALPVENAGDNPGPVQVEIGPNDPFTTIGEPIGTECTVTEVDNGGATSTTVTGSNVTSGGDATIVKPPAGDVPGDADDPNVVTITNTFDATGFTVTKTVDNGGAKDQAGAPIGYPGPYSFTASCLFNGAEQLDPADQSFNVTSGTTHTVTGVPVGSICDVKETDAGGAPSTSIVVTQNGTAGDATDGTDSGVFTLRTGGADVNAVGVTNRYTVGSVKITKKITGAGAATRGSGPFEVKLVCTLDGASPSTVFSGTHEVSKGHLTWTVDNLPTGAACDVAETDKGGADMTTITPGAFVVGDGTTAKITVTNSFDPVPPPPSPTSTEASNLPTTGFPAERLALLVAGLLGLGILTIGAALWARRRE